MLHPAEPQPHERLAVRLGMPCKWGTYPCNSHGREPLDCDCVSRSIGKTYPESAFYIQHLFSLLEALSSTSSVRLAGCRRLAESRTILPFCTHVQSMPSLCMRSPLHTAFRSCEEMKRDTLLLEYSCTRTLPVALAKGKTKFRASLYFSAHAMNPNGIRS